MAMRSPVAEASASTPIFVKPFAAAWRTMRSTCWRSGKLSRKTLPPATLSLFEKATTLIFAPAARRFMAATPARNSGPTISRAPAAIALRAAADAPFAVPPVSKDSTVRFRLPDSMTAMCAAFSMDLPVPAYFPERGRSRATLTRPPSPAALSGCRAADPVFPLPAQAARANASISSSISVGIGRRSARIAAVAARAALVSAFMGGPA